MDAQYDHAFKAGTQHLLPANAVTRLPAKPATKDVLVFIAKMTLLGAISVTAGLALIALAVGAL